MKDNREEELNKMHDRRKKMLKLVFKKDFRSLSMELQRTSPMVKFSAAIPYPEC
jgi:hypothetical protein